MIRRLDLLSTTRPGVWTLPTPSTAGPTDRDLPHQGADDLLSFTYTLDLVGNRPGS